MSSCAPNDPLNALAHEKAGAERALAELSDEVRRYLLARLPASDAADVLQNALLKALTRLDSLRDRNSLRAWFYSIARRELIEHSRRQKREVPVDPHTREESLAGTASDEFEGCGCVLGLTKRLPPKQAAVFRLVEVDEETLSSAALAAHSSTGAAAVSLHRAKKRLRDELESLCGIQDYRGALSCECAELSGTCGSSS